MPATKRTGTGTRYGSTLAEVKAQAARLQSINNMVPWVCVFQYSPRRWSYGIRFYPAGRRPQSEHMSDGLKVRPILRAGVWSATKKRTTSKPATKRKATRRRGLRPVRGTTARRR